MQLELYIEKQLVKKMIINVEAFPEEICGFLFGHESHARMITGIMAARNASTEDRFKHFAIDPLDFLHAEDYATDNNLEFLGIFHSHPNHPAIPSESDRIAAQPFFSYVILSVIQQKFSDIKSWRLNSESKFEEETIIQY